MTHEVSDAQLDHWSSTLEFVIDVLARAGADMPQSVAEVCANEIVPRIARVASAIHLVTLEQVVET